MGLFLFFVVVVEWIYCLYLEYTIRICSLKKRLCFYINTYNRVVVVQTSADKFVKKVIAYIEREKNHIFQKERVVKLTTLIHHIV
jgi:hypothetical protein